MEILATDSPSPGGPDERTTPPRAE